MIGGCGRLHVAAGWIVVAACGPNGSIDLLQVPPPSPPPHCPAAMPAGPMPMPQACSASMMMCPMMLRCDLDAGQCVPCAADSDCMAGQACDASGRCVPLDCVDSGS
jgi:hypothetical protein